MYLLVLLVIFSTLILLYKHGKRNQDYWFKKGVKHEEPIPYFGTMLRSLAGKISIGDYFSEIYRKYPNEKIVGFYPPNDKSLLIRDPELVKHILVSDFYKFHSRGLSISKNEIVDPFIRSLFFASGDTWKLLRQRITPAFTSAKLKAMFPMIVERARTLQKIAAKAAESSKEVDVRELIARYTTDFIGAYGFGINCDSLNDENAAFRILGKRIFTYNYKYKILLFLKMLIPWFMESVSLTPDVTQVTMDFVKRLVQQRGSKPSGGNDFIDLLMELKQEGKIVGDSIDKKNPDGTPKTVELEMDDGLMAAQVFIFFAAGFESSSSASSWTLHHLAFHPEEQRKCQEEIDAALAKNGWTLSYEIVKGMKYLEMCFRESIRITPPGSFMYRECIKEYTIPGTQVTIDPGIKICIPFHAIQTDPKYIHHADEFKPDRFHPDNVNDMPKHVFMPFGEGPRACIGERLALMQSIVGLAAILSQFSVAPSESTLRHPVIDPSSMIVQVVKGGLPLALIARKF